MPKAKPDQVIVHRIELQQSERDAMEAALAGRFITNGVTAVGAALTGLGAALAPFSGALTALATLWIADRTIDEIVESVKQIKEEAPWEWISPSKTLDTFSYISAFMQASNGWDDFNSRTAELANELKSRNASPILEMKLQAFIKNALMTFKTTGQWPQQPIAKAWNNFYSAQEYYNDHGLSI